MKAQELPIEDHVRVSVCFSPYPNQMGSLRFLPPPLPPGHRLRCRLPIPARCLYVVAEYMNGDGYASDSDVVAAESLAFAHTVQVAGDGKDVWIFDVDETLLSKLPHYAVNGYGSEDFNEATFDEWQNLAKAPALPESLRLYEDLLGLGFQMILLTGRVEAERNTTEKNLSFAGYHSWKRLLLRNKRL